MPIFSYGCEICGAGFDLLVFASETPSCPVCQGEKLTKQVSRISAELKAPALARAGRRAAARAGHLANYSRKERGGR